VLVLVHPTKPKPEQKCDKNFIYFSKELDFLPENFPEKQGIS